MLLPDVNVWLSLTFDTHVHHAAANAWYEAGSADPCGFCRLTQLGFLRLATNPAVLHQDAVPLRQAWWIYDTIVRDPRINFYEEPPGIEPIWRSYTQARTFSPKVWNDAYLAAFARAAGYQVVTFDRGFQQYDQLNCLVLT